MSDQKKKTVLVKRPTSLGAKPQYRPMSTDMNDLIHNKRQQKYLKKIVNFLVFILLVCGVAYLYQQQHTASVDLANTKTLLTEEQKKNSDLSEVITKLTEPPTWKELSSADFQELVIAASFPNTTEPASTYPLTGDTTIDNYIVTKAKERGYELRPQAVENKLVQLDGYVMQEETAKAWLALRIAAFKEGISMRLTSAYRSPSDQQAIFLDRSGISGLDVEYILSGLVDDAILATLQYVSPPGYSRHHTGYAIDVEDVNRPTLDEFINSDSYAWLSKNNYENAKKFGFIPSYPSGASNQGPEPEPWEYLFIGTDLVKE